VLPHTSTLFPKETSFKTYDIITAPDLNPPETLFV